jgi:hypothetical protein
VICPTAKAKNFSSKDWTAQISLKCFAKIAFWRTRRNSRERKSAGARVQENDILVLAPTHAGLHDAAGDPSCHETDKIHRPGREGTLGEGCICWRLESLSVSIGSAT